MVALTSHSDVVLTPFYPRGLSKNEIAQAIFLPDNLYQSFFVVL
jgi:hypothetical protein